MVMSLATNTRRTILPYYRSLSRGCVERILSLSEELVMIKVPGLSGLSQVNHRMIFVQMLTNPYLKTP